MTCSGPAHARIGLAGDTGGLRQTDPSSCQRRRMQLGQRGTAAPQAMERPQRPPGQYSRQIHAHVRARRSAPVVRSEHKFLPPAASFRTNALGQINPFHPLSLRCAPTLIVAAAGLGALQKVNVLKAPPSTPPSKVQADAACLSLLQSDPQCPRGGLSREIAKEGVGTTGQPSQLWPPKWLSGWTLGAQPGPRACG